MRVHFATQEVIRNMLVTYCQKETENQLCLQVFNPIYQSSLQVFTVLAIFRPLNNRKNKIYIFLLYLNTFAVSLNGSDGSKRLSNHSRCFKHIVNIIDDLLFENRSHENLFRQQLNIVLNQSVQYIMTNFCLTINSSKNLN